MSRFTRLLVALGVLSLSMLAFERASSAAPRSGSLGPSVLRAPVTEKVAEQGILTPVPVRIELADEMKARRVLVHYRLFGAPEWTTLELSRTGRQWTAIIPCLEVSTVTGDLVYYIRVHDAEGGVIAYSGSRYRPYRVRIVRPPGREEAQGRCPDPADCPAGLPGCPSEAVVRTPCRTDRDCEGGKTCGWDGFCESTERRSQWWSLEVEQDVGVVSTAGACSVSSQENEGYGCYRDDGERYIGNPVYTNEPLRPAAGPTRIVLGYERLFFYGSTVGVRVGYAFRGDGPTAPGGAAFWPVLFEARLAHWFGTDPFTRAGIRTFVFASAGAGMFDLEFRTHVREDPTLRSVQGGNALEQDVNGWKRAGDAFVGLGGGVLIPILEGAGPAFEVAVAQVFPFGATLLLPRVGWRIGFR